LLSTCQRDAILSLYPLSSLLTMTKQESPAVADKPARRGVM